MAETRLLVWFNEFSKLEFGNFNELKRVYGNASIVNNNRVVFNIKGNDCRLIARIIFKTRTVFIRFIGTHKAYDLLDIKQL